MSTPTVYYCEAWKPTRGARQFTQWRNRRIFHTNIIVADDADTACAYFVAYNIDRVNGCHVTCRPVTRAQMHLWTRCPNLQPEMLSSSGARTLVLDNRPGL